MRLETPEIDLGTQANLLRVRKHGADGSSRG
jgi:hypothetical protein